MKNMEEAVAAFVCAIKESEEYQAYVREKVKVKQFPELKAQIDEFRRRNYVMQTREDTAFEEIEQFEKEYANFREQPLVSDFLAAELAFCRLMQQINISVTDSLDFE